MKPAREKTCPACGEPYDSDVLFCPKDGTPLHSARHPSTSRKGNDPYLGLELAGQIRLKHLIGIGSMGRVYRAFQAGIERDVAVKILHRELSGNAELCARFHREAKVASRLTHPNVVQVLMTGTVPHSGDRDGAPPEARVGGELYLVMEHLDGISLLSALAAAGQHGGEGAALPLTRALHITLQICDAVGEAHKQGIVHRDLKPENVMLVHRGDDPDYVKVLDFGIARLEWGSGEMSTQAGLIFGTAKYISPEGAEGLPVAPPADVYAIATMLFQMLAGRTTFEGESPVALLVQHTHTPPPELRSIARASYVPDPIAAVIMQNLAKKPAERAANARVLGRELIAAARASGFDPEEIISQSALLFARGAVKLPSKERTKTLELSANLAARIGGVAAVASPTSMPAGRDDEAPESDDAGPTSPPRSRPSARGGGSPDSVHSGRPSRRASMRATPSPPPGVRRGSRPPREPDLDFDDSDGSEGAPRSPQLSTMHGAELERDAPRGPRPPVARLALMLGCVLAAVLILVIGGKRLGGLGASASSDSVETHVQAARDCIRRRAWNSPAHQNVKEILAAGLARWPGEPRLLDVRREAGERLVAEALGRRYAGEAADALRLARLALELSPELTVAERFVADLESPRTPDVAPAVDAGNADEGAAKAVPRRPRDGRPTAPAPSSGPAVAPSSAVPVLPPSPPPLPAEHAPPAPAASGPWL